MLRMRAAGTETVYYECDIGAAGWGGPVQHVLCLAERNGVWLAIHAPKKTSLDVLLDQPSATIVFSCLGENILQEGEHNWRAPP